jgi:hypothetical protein
VADHFARLGVERVPWIDPGVLKNKFLALSAEQHPDKAGADKTKAEVDFRDLNESYNVLRNARTRILHLLELASVPQAPHVGVIPQEALELFGPIAEITKRADALLKEKALANSPMLKVQFFGKSLACVEELQARQSEVQQRIKRIEESLKRSPEPHELQNSAAALGYLERWHGQLGERATALTF